MPNFISEDQIEQAILQKLEQQFAREIEVIKRNDSLETIARDIAYHFPRRGYLGQGHCHHGRTN